MSITLQQVIDALSPDEPNYMKAAKLGPEALPHLNNIITNADADPMLASKAAYLAGLLPFENSKDVLKNAAMSKYDIVRIAVASTLQNLSPPTAQIIADILKNDKEPGVQKFVQSFINKKES